MYDFVRPVDNGASPRPLGPVAGMSLSKSIDDIYNGRDTRDVRVGVAVVPYFGDVINGSIWGFRITSP